MASTALVGPVVFDGRAFSHMPVYAKAEWTEAGEGMAVKKRSTAFTLTPTQSREVGRGLLDWVRDAADFGGMPDLLYFGGFATLYCTVNTRQGETKTYGAGVNRANREPYNCCCVTRPGDS